MPTLETNTENTQNFNLTGLTAEDLYAIQQGLIELQAKLTMETAFIEDWERVRILFHAIDELIIQA